MPIRTEFTHLWLEAPEALFSDAQDYRGALGLLAELCSPAQATANHLLGYCLLADQMHLLLATNVHQAGKVADQLMSALTGSANHPLRRAWQSETVAGPQLPSELARLHNLPCNLGLVGAAEVHPWSSHLAYANPSLAPPWLAAELFWQQWPTRRAGRVRAYLHLLRTGSAPVRHKKKSVASQTYSVTEQQIAERVLRDHQCSWAQLSSARMLRRKRMLAGLCAAIARGLGIFNEGRSQLPALFGVDAELMGHYERLANREAGQYLVSTASALISQPASARPPLLQEPPLLAEPLQVPDDDDGPLDYIDADSEPGLRLVL